MKKYALFMSIFFSLNVIFYSSPVFCQEPMSWLSVFTNDIIVGSYTYNYYFTEVDNNACKLRIDEKKTDKKGSSSIKSFIVHLADVDPISVNFKISGSNVIVNIGIKQSQKFVTVLEDDVVDSYANSISVYMSEVDNARSFIDAIKTHSEDCKGADRIWTSRQEAFAWLEQNIGESTASGTTYKQSFTKGEKDYLAALNTESTDSKGIQGRALYNYNLSDIDPAKINLVVSGKYFKIEVPVRDLKYYLQLKKGETITYAKELEIYSDEIEQARNIFNAMAYLASETKTPERTQWDNYSAALDYVKSSISEVQAGSYTYAQELSFEASPSGMVHITISKTDSKGAVTVVKNSFYLNDLQSPVKLSASSKNVSLELQIRDKNKFIKQTNEGAIISYTYDLEIYQTGIEEAREMMNALECAMAKSTSGVIEFASTDRAIQWIGENVGEVKIDAETTKQSIEVNTSNENNIHFQTITSEEGSADITRIYEIYPEDVIAENLEIEVSGKKLWVTLSTGKLKYIKNYRDDILQSYTYNADVLFDDVLKAKNFIAAVRVIHDKSLVPDRSMSDISTAARYIIDHTIKMEIDGATIEQKAENRDNDDCKMSYMRTETDSKGVATEYKYEFTLSDIDPEDSKVYISGKELQVKLETRDNVKLIKPYKNGEAGSFVYSIDLLVDDVLIAKKMLGAFTTLSAKCK